MRVRLAAVTAALLLTGAACGDDADSEAPTVAPYLDIVSGTADVTAIHDKTGQASFTAAFVVADDSGACTPTWGGDTALDDDSVKAEIAKIHAIGGQLIVATGGESGTYLENACAAPELATAYEKALDAAGSNHLDVDIEQDVTPATATAALAAVQKARGTAVTLTLPVDGTDVGLPDPAIALLTSAKAAGVDVTVNAMTMNFTATGDWGKAMTVATEAVKEDVARVWPDKPDDQLYAMLGVTPMIGANDTGPATTLADARTLLAWAEQKGLGFVRFWSVNRDNGGCADRTVSDTCSGIGQDDYAFTALFKTFR